MTAAARPSAAALAAAALLARSGARATRARVDVLATLVAAGEALAHHDVERRLPRGHGVDRVTLYRVLDWLTAQRLAHKHAGDDRVWRFAAAAHPGAGRAAAADHAHFQCSECGKVVCLPAAKLPPIVLPAGFRRRDVEVTVKGACDRCAR